MWKYVARRLLLGIPTLIGISLIIFASIRIIPGDPTQIEDETAGFVFTEEERQRLREILGIDRPLHIQYLTWMGGLARGDLGTSFVAKTPVIEIIRHRGPVSAQIGIMAIAVGWLMGVPLGIYGAVRQNSIGDYISRFFAVLLLAMPAFLMGLLIIIIAVIWFAWRPPLIYTHLWTDPWSNFQMTIGPALVMGVNLGAVFARVTRSSVLDILSSEYVRTARAKGLTEQRVLMGHVLRNSVIPVVTISGLALGGLIGGAVAVEQAFSVPGIGLSLIVAVQSSDWPLIQSLVFLYGVSFIVVNIIIDISYVFIDPRIRTG
ncbi:MAG: ABC transporter permease [Chloroflexi bacterium]|nr:ABC transporter permease [Chloroflexota bacterium]